MRVFKNKMFHKWAKSEGLSDKALLKAVKEIEKGLIDADLGSGLIKKRLARKGQGKSSGFRTMVAFKKYFRTFFIYGFQKNQRDNINEQEKRALKKLAHELLDMPDSKLNEIIINGDLYEVHHEKNKKN
jgi:hypothetical protein